MLSRCPLRTILPTMAVLATTVFAGSPASAASFNPVPVTGTNINILIEGQSNAAYFSIYGGMNLVATDVSYLLGFDGKTHTVTILGGSGRTAWGSTGLVPDPLVAPSLTWLAGSMQSGWQDGAMETAFINYLKALSRITRSSPTATIWMHNENDSFNQSITQPEWQSAIAYNVAEERAALGQGSATTPIDFVFVPFDFSPGNLQAMGCSPVVQTLKAGYEALAATPGFNAVVAAQIGDSNMDGPPGATGPYGGLHMDQSDINQAAFRIAVTIANQFWMYAHPGSPEASAHGAYDWAGPQGIMLLHQGAYQVSVVFSIPPGPGGFATLSAGAATGAGWTIVDGSTIIHATAAKVVGPALLLTFGAKVPMTKSARLYYGYGDGRIFVGSSTPVVNKTVEGPGEGMAVYDAWKVPAWLPAAGLLFLN